MAQKRLKRSQENKVFLGVLGGLAEYTGIQATVLRILFVILLFPSGFTAILIYFLAAFLMKNEE
ncbi:PspC domain-containing protein [Bacillus testis]|uniref:PspC domain-containing protein n=1 Tax=Bacillus testis TaxID=1622072 RepID=UPI00067F71F4|nr:PspC domain-containing protein [Bacillus testis]